MKLRLFVKLSEIAGQSIVELALVLPLLLALVVGIFDLSRAIQANNIISNMSREGANLASRTPRTSITYQEIMHSLAHTAQPLTMDTNGMMYITEVRNVGGTPTIQMPQEAWENTTAGPGSNINQSNVAARLGSINIPEGESVYIFEVVYTYKWLFMPAYSNSPQMELRSTTIF
jgi:Flp pilus assembly protein TadG